MDNTFRKKTPTAQRKQYSPVALVKEHGDRWAYFDDAVSPHTKLALYGYTDDRNDAMMMNLYEQGVLGRSGVV